MYIDDPVSWARERLQGAYMWSKIEEIARSVVDNRYTAVHSCHGIGKSWVSGGAIVPWWLDTHPPGEAVVVTSAPSAAQIEAILWKEINRSHKKASLRGRITWGAIPKWKIGDEIVAFGRKPQDLANEEEARQAFQGIHAKYVLVVLDEACGIPGWLWDATMALVTNEYCRVLAIGNPDDPTSRFQQICMQSKNWNVIHVDAYDSPLFTGEWIPEELKYLLISPTWVEEMKEEWGEDSPIYEAKVRGRFPMDSDFGVVPWSFLAQCRNCTDKYTDFEMQPNELGIDPAAGGDQFTIHWRTGPLWRSRWGFNHKDTMKSTGECVRIINETKATRVKIDTIGIGKGVADRLAEQRGHTHEAEVVQVNVSRASYNPKRYKNLRAQLWWECGRQMLEKNNANLSLLDDRTANQLVSCRYEINSTGLIQIEPKDEVKKRIKRSPDDADAFLLAYYTPAKTDLGTAGVASVGGHNVEDVIVKRGDLVLRGSKYEDKE